jgi:hypothetical protein
MLNEKAKNEAAETVEFFLKKAESFDDLPSEELSIDIIRRAAKCLLDSDTPLAEDDGAGLEEQAIAMLKRLYGKRPADMDDENSDYCHKFAHQFEDGTIIEVIVTIPAEDTGDDIPF